MPSYHDEIENANGHLGEETVPRLQPLRFLAFLRCTWNPKQPGTLKWMFGDFQPFLVGGWTNPFENMLVKMGIFPK